MQNVVSMIITDYRSIPRSVKMCLEFSKKCLEKLIYIIVDNSLRHDGKGYIEENEIDYMILSSEGNKPIYSFYICGQSFILIDANENGGYAKGNNLGAKVARKYFHTKYYIFSNNDLEFPEKIKLERFYKLFQADPRIGIIGPDVLYQGKEHQNPRRDRGIISQMILGDFNALWFHCRFNRYLGSLERTSSEGEAGWVTGCFFIADANAFWEVGGFDEATFLYAEEMIISHRMREKGRIVYYYPGIKVIHLHRGTDGREMRTIHHRSKIYYYETYKKTGGFLLFLAHASFLITEWGYYLYHDLLKKKIFAKRIAARS